MASDPAAAEQAARRLLRTAPSDPSVQLILASALRRRGDMAAARAILEPLAKAHARAALTWFELGVARSGCGDGPGAIHALRHAVSVKPEMPEAWEALGREYFRSGDGAAMDAAYAQQRKYALKDPRLRAAADAMLSRPNEAERMLRSHLAAAPQDGDARKMLGDLLIQRERLRRPKPSWPRCWRRRRALTARASLTPRPCSSSRRRAAAMTQMRLLLAKTPAGPVLSQPAGGRAQPGGRVCGGRKPVCRAGGGISAAAQALAQLRPCAEDHGPGDGRGQAYRRCLALAPAFRRRL